MNWKSSTLIALGVVALIAVGIFAAGKSGSSRGITVTLRLAVSPEQQLDYVIRQVDSAKFKYIVGVKAGVKPVLAQKLSLKAVPKSSLADGRITVMTREEGQRYLEAFMETLQAECAGQAQVTLVQQSIR